MILRIFEERLAAAYGRGTAMGNPKYVYYPEPRCCENQVPYKKDGRKSNPAVTGFWLVISAWLLESFPFLRRYIWKNTGFEGLRPIRHEFEHYETCFEPLIIPTKDFPSSASEREILEPTPSVSPPVRREPGKYYSVADYHALYRSGELTPIAVAKAILPLIRRDTTPPGTHSEGWFDTKVDLVLKAAEASTKRWKEGQPLGLLDGIPTGIKDDYDVEGYVTTMGTVSDFTSPRIGNNSITSWAVQQLEDVGVVILGKLHMHEFGLDTSGNNPFKGTPRNPYNQQYYTGGSSSGCAYSLATGLIPIAVGGDGGGSIRIPSSFCSVFGLKPTHGRVSFRPAMNHSTGCAVNGPLAADIQSLATVFQVLSTPDPTSLFPPLAPINLKPATRTKVMGISQEWFSQATPAIQRLCRTLIYKMVSKYNYTVIDIDIPYLPEGQMAHAMSVLSDAAVLLPETKTFTPANRVMLALGTATPATDYLLAQKLRMVLMQHLAYLWKQHPGMILMTPTTACAGWPIRQGKGELEYGISDGNTTLKTMEYVWMGNFLGLPGLTVPAGFVVPEGREREGEEAGPEVEGRVPVGLMAMGEWATEEALLQWGVDAEEVGEELECRCRPPNWVDVVGKAKEEMIRARSEEEAN